MQDDTLAAIKAALEALDAKKSWCVNKRPRKSHRDGKLMYQVDGAGQVFDYEDWGFTEPTARYIAACSPDRIAALVAEVERLRAERVPRSWQLVPVEPTDLMLEAYLQANTKYWLAANELQAPPSAWRPGTPRQATAQGWRAMLAAAPKAESQGER